MFYTFYQNNSGGVFSFKQDAISHFVIIEAESDEEANKKAESLGIYFDGCSTGRDCECCGDRWSACYDNGCSSGEPFPCIYGEDVSTGVYTGTHSWMEDRPEGFIHYVDGRIVPVHVQKEQVER
jgi:hypothetical protein